MGGNPFEDEDLWDEAPVSDESRMSVSSSVSPACSPGRGNTERREEEDPRWALPFGDSAAIPKLRSEIDRRMRFCREAGKQAAKLSETVSKVTSRASGFSELMNTFVGDVNPPYGSQEIFDMYQTLSGVGDELKGPHALLSFSELAAKGKDAIACLDVLERRRRDAEGARRALEKYDLSPRRDAGRAANLKNKLVEAETNHQAAYSSAKARVSALGKDFPNMLRRCFASLIKCELEVLERACVRAPDSYHNDISWLCADSGVGEALAISNCRQSNALMEKMRAFKRMDSMQAQLKQLIAVNGDLNAEIRSKSAQVAQLVMKNDELQKRVQELNESNEQQRRRSLTLNDEKTQLSSRLEKSMSTIRSMQGTVHKLESERELDQRQLEERSRQAEAGAWHKRTTEHLTEELGAVRRELDAYKAAMADLERKKSHHAGASADAEFGHLGDSRERELRSRVASFGRPTNPFDDIDDDLSDVQSQPETVASTTSSARNPFDDEVVANRIGRALESSADATHEYMRSKRDALSLEEKMKLIDNNGFASCTQSTAHLR